MKKERRREKGVVSLDLIEQIIFELMGNRGNGFPGVITS